MKSRSAAYTKKAEQKCSASRLSYFGKFFPNFSEPSVLADVSKIRVFEEPLDIVEPSAYRPHECGDAPFGISDE